MLLNFDTLYNKYNMTINGVIHIGAHHGQEFSIYDRYKIENVILFEPHPTTFEKLKSNLRNKSINGKKPILVNCALGNKTGKIKMNCETANEGQSSSLLKPGIHLTQYPWIKFNYQIDVDIIKLDDYDMNENNFNMINIDVQGYELEVFKGAKDILKNIDYIICEVNRAEVYKDCAKVDELDKYLSTYGFERVETNWEGTTWGDAFYIKKEK